MQQTSIINKFGKVAGWNSVTIRLLGRDLVGVTALEYEDSVEKENVMGAGRYPVAQGEGNYSAKASVTLLQEERLNLLDALPPGKTIQDIEAFDVVVEYEYQNRPYRDVIRNCQFTNNGTSVQQSDKSIAFKYDLLCTHIDYNV